MDLYNGMAALSLIGFLVWLFIGAAGLVLTVLWIVLPFSVFAIRRRVDEQDAILLRIEGHLARIASTHEGSPPSPAPLPPKPI